MSFVNWMIDQFASEDVIDLYFVLSDLADVNTTDAEACESAYFDSLCTHEVENNPIDPNIPIAKQVF